MAEENPAQSRTFNPPAGPDGRGAPAAGRGGRSANPFARAPVEAAIESGAKQIRGNRKAVVIFIDFIRARRLFIPTIICVCVVGLKLGVLAQFEAVL